MAQTTLTNAMEIIIATLDSGNPYDDKVLYNIVRDLCSFTEYLTIMDILTRSKLIRSELIHTIVSRAK